MGNILKKHYSWALRGQQIGIINEVNYIGVTCDGTGKWDYIDPCKGSTCR